MRYLSVILVLIWFNAAGQQKDTVKRQTDSLQRELIKAKSGYEGSNISQPEFEKGIRGQTAQKEANAPLTVRALQEVVVSLVVRNPAIQPDMRGPTDDDDRVEVLKLDPTVDWQKKMLLNAASVGIVIEKRMLRKVRDSVYELDMPQTLGHRFNLCRSEPFIDQPVIGVGTAFAIGKDRMITAQHVWEAPLDNYAVIFDFKLLNQKGVFSPLVFSRNIYFPKKINASDDDLDVSLFTLDRPLACPPLRCILDKRPAYMSRVYMIGYPSGLPEKVALNAEATDVKDNRVLYTSLDAFQGNSGSPVFDRDTHQVIGLLVSGGVDLRPNGGCNISAVCTIPYCPGEKVVRITALPEEWFTIPGDHTP